jgi:very-short-patch-repair endonuclease
VRARTQIARKLRRNATEAEKRLWRALRERLSDQRFRRQHPIGSFIVDFASPRQKLVIELDGGQHAEQQDLDHERAVELTSRGYRVVRFWNSEVMSNLDGVMEAIHRELDQHG